MNESELVEGAEYEGRPNRSVDTIVRGRLHFDDIDMRSRRGNPKHATATLIRSDGDNQAVWLDTLRPVEPITEAPATIADGAIGRRETCITAPICPNCQAPWELRADRCSDCPTTGKSLAANAQKLVSGPVGSSRDQHGSESGGPRAEDITSPATGLTEPERPTADDLAWAVRRETLAAEERKRWHYEERCKAYGESADDSGTTYRVNPAVYAAVSAIMLDRAIARVKPTERDEPAYRNDAWPCDAGEEYEL